MKIAIAQINPTVGALEKNAQKIIDHIKIAKEKGAELVVFPELAITGYPPEDLLLKPQFIDDNLSALHSVIKASTDIAVYVGFVDKIKEDLYNAGAFIVNGKLVKVYHKMNLPNYSVFDEKRYFKEGKTPVTVSYKGLKIRLSICEDVWTKTKGKSGPKIQLELVINASPYNIGKQAERESIVKKRALSTKAHIVYVNMVGGQDELVFDGSSFAFNSKGEKTAAAPNFREEIVIFEDKLALVCDCSTGISEVYEALKLAIHDYVDKNGFKDVVIGLSGGIDSALTATIAADALGTGRVHTIFMPSQYSAQQSKDDSKALTKNLGIHLDIIPITEIFEMYLSDITKYFRGRPEDTTEENMQARIRAVILMAMSNKHGWLLLSTGNKSETSTGYCTLYGDMAGGFNLLKDVPKTMVYELSKWRNEEKEVIPKSIIERAPTAELRPDQKDQDTLPPYDVLDKIIEAYVEKNKSAKQIIAMGIEMEVVKRTIRMIDMSEYKRRQSAPGPRITSRAFGKDWRLPITNGYKF